MLHPRDVNPRYTPGSSRISALRLIVILMMIEVALSPALVDLITESLSVAKIDVGTSRG